MFKISIHGYKVLSEIFLERYKEEKGTKKLGVNHDKDYNSKPSQDKPLFKTKLEGKREYYKKMEFLTYILDQLQKRDHQVESELENYLKTIKLEK